MKIQKTVGKCKKYIIFLWMYLIGVGLIYGIVDYWSHSWNWELKSSLQYSVVQDFPQVFYIDKPANAKIVINNSDNRNWESQITLIVQGPIGFNSTCITTHWTLYDFSNNIRADQPDRPIIDVGNSTVTVSPVLENFDGGFSAYYIVTLTLNSYAPLGYYYAKIVTNVKLAGSDEGW